MANESIRILVDVAVKGRDVIKGLSGDVEKLDGAGKKASGGMGLLNSQTLAIVGVMGAAAVAAKQLYGALRGGAELKTIQERFGKLSASIDTTAQSLLGGMRTATQGMISDMELMASASQIVSLGLANNSGQVTRLATVVGTLGWDMQQVILTFANLSTMRLDALGLSVEEVTAKQKELEAQGYSTAAAFKEAVIQAGEARLAVGGVSEEEKNFKKLEASIANSKNELSLFLVEMAKGVGLIDAFGRAADRLFLERMVSGMVKAGEVTVRQGNLILQTYEETGSRGAAMFTALQAQSATALNAMDGGLVQNIESYRMWSGATAAAMNAGQSAVAGATQAIISSVLAADAVLMQVVANWQRAQASIPSAQAMTNRYAGWIDQTNKRNRASEEARAAMLEEASAAGSLGGAISMVTTAEQALAEAHARLASTFASEVSAKAEDMLITPDGVVNVENANKALYEQFKIAGATAGQLAILGVATGQFTQAQAEATLRAAILQEKMRQIATQAVATGDISGALGAFNAYKQQLDSGTIDGAAGSLEGLAQAADEFSGDYAASISVEDRAAMLAISDAQQALNDLSGTYYVNIVTTSSSGTPSPGGGASGLPTGGTPGGGVTPANFEDPNQGVTRQRVSPGPGISANSTRAGDNGLASGRSGGAVYNVNVNNYIDGQAQGRAGVDDVTTDKLMAALKGLGVRS